jgi:hypothetical protein
MIDFENDALLENILDLERDLVSKDAVDTKDCPPFKLDSSASSKGSSHTPRFREEEPVVATLYVGELVVFTSPPKQKSKPNVFFNPGDKSGALIHEVANSADFARSEKEWLFGDMKDGEDSDTSLS